MAKKDKKDEIEDNDNINKDSSKDFNEADDSFGLPDVDYQPIDRDENTYEEEQASSEPESEETYSTKEEETDVYTSTTYEEEPPVEQESTYVPGSYKPPKDDSVVPKVLALVFVLLLAGAAIWYFGFYKPAKEAKEKAKIEQQKRLDDQKQREAEAQRERERLEREQAQREEEARLAAEAEPKIGTIETISSRTGRYYVVIASAIDDDLAMDHAEKLKNEGVSTTIIKPFGKSKFHRIAVESHDTWAAAENAATDLRGQYGDGVWVIKY